MSHEQRVSALAADVRCCRLVGDNHGSRMVEQGAWCVGEPAKRVDGPWAGDERMRTPGQTLPGVSTAATD